MNFVNKVDCSNFYLFRYFASLQFSFVLPTLIIQKVACFALYASNEKTMEIIVIELFILLLLIGKRDCSGAVAQRMNGRFDFYWRINYLIFLALVTRKTTALISEIEQCVGNRMS